MSSQEQHDNNNDKMVVNLQKVRHEQTTVLSESDRMESVDHI